MSPVRKRARQLWPVLMAAWLASCGTAPAAKTSGIEAPAVWNHLQSTAADDHSVDMPLMAVTRAEIEHRWWTTFDDPALERLIADALAGSRTLRIAEARVAEARAETAGARANLYPQVAVTGDASRGNQGYATNNKTINVTDLGLQASWEVDVFGKNRARVGQAVAILQSTEARRDAAVVTLLADVARAYFDLRNYEAQIRITQENLATQQHTLELIKAQQIGALTSNLDVARAAAQVASTSAQLPALRADYDLTLNQLNVLTGKPPGSIQPLAGSQVQSKPPSSAVLIAAPATVLANRPDVRAAERAFAASRAGSDVAAREIYPTISLTGLFGVQDSSLFNATPWTIGANFAQPLLNFGRIRADIDAADARQTQAFASYQQTVLEALADMESALSLYLNESSRRRDLAAAAEENRKSVELATQQYVSGFINLLDLLVAQRDELEAESNLATSDALLRKNLVYIYTAAGGGWRL